jgi:hypothetical protein
MMDMNRVNADFSGWSNLAKEFYNIDKGYVYQASESEINFHEIFTDGGASIFPGVNFVRTFLARNAADRRTADQIWDTIVKTVNDKYLPTWLANIT